MTGHCLKRDHDELMESCQRIQPIVEKLLYYILFFHSKNLVDFFSQNCVKIRASLYPRQHLQAFYLSGECECYSPYH